MKWLIAALLFLSSPLEISDSIFDFQSANDLKGWYVVNDGVMGGLSKGDLALNENGNAVFKGYVTTENNGGFSSIRYRFKSRNVSDFSAVVLQLKGDGKMYQFRIKENSYQRESYIQYFETTGDWQTIEIPFENFYPSYRGYKLNRGNFEGEKMSEIAFLIGNKVKESFSLEIKSISLK